MLYYFCFIGSILKLSYINTSDHTEKKGFNPEINKMNCTLVRGATLLAQVAINP